MPKNGTNIAEIYIARDKGILDQLSNDFKPSNGNLCHLRLIQKNYAPITTTETHIRHRTHSFACILTLIIYIF